MFTLPGDGLSNLPQDGDSFSCWVLSEDGAGDTYLAYGVQNPSTSGGPIEDYYFANIDFSNDKLVLFKRVNGNTSSINSTNVSVSADTWYYLDIHWNSGTHDISLYDIDENYVGSMTASDSTFTDGGIGFISYPGNSDRAFYWDYFINGDYPSSLTGGWGPETKRFTHKMSGGPTYDYFENYEFFFKDMGYYEPNNSRLIAVGAFLHTHEASDTADPNYLQPSDLLYDGAIDNTQLEIQLSNTDGSSLDKDTDAGGNGILLDRVPSRTHYLHLTQSQWDNAINNNLHEYDSPDDVRQRAIDTTTMQNDALGVGELDILGLVMGGVGVFAGGPLGVISSAAATTVTFFNLIDEFQENPCGYSPGPSNFDYDKQVWDSCSPDLTPYMAYVSTYEIDYSDIDKPLNMEVTQKVDSSHVTTGTITTTCTWDVHIPGDATDIESMSLNSEPTIDRPNINDCCE